MICLFHFPSLQPCVDTTFLASMQSFIHTKFEVASMQLHRRKVALMRLFQNYTEHSTYYLSIFYRHPRRSSIVPLHSCFLSIYGFLTFCDFRQLPDVLDGPGGDDLLAVWTFLVAAAPREDSRPLKDSSRDEYFSRPSRHSKFRESITSHLVGLCV